MQVLVYGEWEGSSSNIKSFFTATYTESDKLPLMNKALKSRINFVFLGTLVRGKNPLYALQLVEALSKKGYDVRLSLYGDGTERTRLEHYNIANQLETIIELKATPSCGGRNWLKKA
jgi:glycosyltransferase involved in cell wall biosynthesis